MIYSRNYFNPIRKTALKITKIGRPDREFSSTRQVCLEAWLTDSKKPAYNNSMQTWKKEVETAKMIAARLERLSADSVWAHRASGLRGSLLRQILEIKKLESEPEEETLAHLGQLIDQSHFILAQAAKEIPDPEYIRGRLNLE